MADLDRAVKIDPDAYSYDNRGDVWRRLGKNDQAIVDYNMAIRLDPTFVAAYLDRGHAFKAIGNRKSALADYQAVLDMPDKGRAIDKWAKKEAKDAIAALDKE
jgi:tetratricopeptide (TPR) repeat protein